jgi:hypothetical protein
MVDPSLLVSRRQECVSSWAPDSIVDAHKESTNSTK